LPSFVRSKQDESSEVGRRPVERAGSPRAPGPVGDGQATTLYANTNAVAVDDKDA